MLLHYFLVSLKPISINAPPPMSTQDFLHHARDCLSDDIVQDLQHLHLLTTLNQTSWSNHESRQVLCDLMASKLDFEISPDVANKPLVTRLLYWTWLKKAANTKIVKLFADEASFLYQMLAFVLAHEEHACDEILRGCSKTPSALCDVLPSYEIHASAFTAHPYYHVLTNALKDSNPLQLELTVAKYLCAIIEQHCRDGTFSLDHVFAYFVKLIVCERHASFDYAQGHMMLEEFIKEAITHERA